MQLRRLFLAKTVQSYHESGPCACALQTQPITQDSSVRTKMAAKTPKKGPIEPLVWWIGVGTVFSYSGTGVVVAPDMVEAIAPRKDVLQQIVCVLVLGEGGMLCCVVDVYIVTRLQEERRK